MHYHPRPGLAGHAGRWLTCRRCPLHAGRKNVCLVRGMLRPDQRGFELHLPATVLFTGQAPGLSEDATGLPFTGPAGHLLDMIIRRAWGSAWPPRWTWAFTNLVGCVPRDEASRETDPPEEAIQCCAPRLDELVALAQPKLLVAVGSIARDGLGPKRRPATGSYTFQGKMSVVALQHPAYILRQVAGQQDLLMLRAVAALRSAAETYLEALL